MKPRHTVLIMMFAVAAVGCSRVTSQSTDVDAANATTSKSAISTNPIHTAGVARATRPASAKDGALLHDVTPGMAYAEFRSKVIQQGWRPKPDRDCLTNVIGSNFKDICAANGTLCRVCNDMPELSAYSGDGQLLAYFENPTDHRVLRVGGSGELQTWNQRGREADLQVASWAVEGGK